MPTFVDPALFLSPTSRNPMKVYLRLLLQDKITLPTILPHVGRAPSLLDFL